MSFKSDTKLLDKRKQIDNAPYDLKDDFMNDSNMLYIRRPNLIIPTMNPSDCSNLYVHAGSTFHPTRPLNPRETPSLPKFPTGGLPPRNPVVFNNFNKSGSTINGDNLDTYRPQSTRRGLPQGMFFGATPRSQSQAVPVLPLMTILTARSDRASDKDEQIMKQTKDLPYSQNETFNLKNNYEGKNNTCMTNTIHDPLIGTSAFSSNEKEQHTDFSSHVSDSQNTSKFNVLEPVNTDLEILRNTHSTLLEAVDCMPPNPASLHHSSQVDWVPCSSGAPETARGERTSFCAAFSSGINTSEIENFPAPAERHFSSSPDVSSPNQNGNTDCVMLTPSNIIVPVVPKESSSSLSTLPSNQSSRRKNVTTDDDNYRDNNARIHKTAMLQKIPEFDEASLTKPPSPTCMVSSRAIFTDSHSSTIASAHKNVSANVKAGKKTKLKTIEDSRSISVSHGESSHQFVQLNEKQKNLSKSSSENVMASAQRSNVTNLSNATIGYDLKDEESEFDESDNDLADELSIPSLRREGTPQITLISRSQVLSPLTNQIDRSQILRRPPFKNDMCCDETPNPTRVSSSNSLTVLNNNNNNNSNNINNLNKNSMISRVPSSTCVFPKDPPVQPEHNVNTQNRMVASLNRNNDLQINLSTSLQEIQSQIEKIEQDNVLQIDQLRHSFHSALTLLDRELARTFAHADHAVQLGTKAMHGQNSITNYISTLNLPQQASWAVKTFVEGAEFRSLVMETAQAVVNKSVEAAVGVAIEPLKRQVDELNEQIKNEKERSEALRFELNDRNYGLQSNLNSFTTLTTSQISQSAESVQLLENNMAMQLKAINKKVSACLKNAKDFNEKQNELVQQIDNFRGRRSISQPARRISPPVRSAAHPTKVSPPISGKQNHQASHPSRQQASSSTSISTSRRNLNIKKMPLNNLQVAPVEIHLSAVSTSGASNRVSSLSSCSSSLRTNQIPPHSSSSSSIKVIAPPKVHSISSTISLAGSSNSMATDKPLQSSARNAMNQFPKNSTNPKLHVSCTSKNSLVKSSTDCKLDGSVDRTSPQNYEKGSSYGTSTSNSPHQTDRPSTAVPLHKEVGIVTSPIKSATKKDRTRRKSSFGFGIQVVELDRSDDECPVQTRDLETDLVRQQSPTNASEVPSAFDSPNFAKFNNKKSIPQTIGSAHLNGIVSSSESNKSNQIKSKELNSNSSMKGNNNTDTIHNKYPQQVNQPELVTSRPDSSVPFRPASSGLSFYYDPAGNNNNSYLNLKEEKPNLRDSCSKEDPIKMFLNSYGYEDSSALPSVTTNQNCNPANRIHEHQGLLQAPTPIDQRVFTPPPFYMHLPPVPSSSFAAYSDSIPSARQHNSHHVLQQALAPLLAANPLNNSTQQQLLADPSLTFAPHPNSSRLPETVHWTADGPQASPRTPMESFRAPPDQPEETPLGTVIASGSHSPALVPLPVSSLSVSAVEHDRLGEIYIQERTNDSQTINDTMHIKQNSAQKFVSSPSYSTDSQVNHTLRPLPAPSALLRTPTSTSLLSSCNPQRSSCIATTPINSIRSPAHLGSSQSVAQLQHMHNMVMSENLQNNPYHQQQQQQQSRANLSELPANLITNSFHQCQNSGTVSSPNESFHLKNENENYATHNQKNLKQQFTTPGLSPKSVSISTCGMMKRYNSAPKSLQSFVKHATLPQKPVQSKNPLIKNMNSNLE